MKKLLLTIFILMTVVSGFSLNLESIGYAYISSESVLGGSIHYYDSLSGPDLFIDTRGGDIEQISEELGVTIAAADSLQTAQFSSYKVLFSGNGFELIAKPETFSIDGQDILPLIPSGVRFYYSDKLDYDFRIVSGNYFIQISGQFINEETLLNKLLLAVNDPVSYLQAHDSEYIYELLLRGFDEMDSLRSSLEEYRLSLGELRVENDALRDQIALLEQKDQQLEQDLVELTQEQSLVNSTFSQMIDKLQYSLVYYQNTGFFRGPTLVAREAYDRVLQLAAENPNMDVDGIYLKAEEEALSVSKQEVALILSVHFNVF